MATMAKHPPTLKAMATIMAPRHTIQKVVIAMTTAMCIANPLPTQQGATAMVKRITTNIWRDGRTSPVLRDAPSGPLLTKTC